MTMKWLHEEICEELEGSEKYAKKALKMKEKGEKEMASLFLKMAEQEYDHAQTLLDMAHVMKAKGMSELHDEVWKYMEECAKERQIKAKAKIMAAQ